MGIRIVTVVVVWVLTKYSCVFLFFLFSFSLPFHSGQRPGHATVFQKCGPLANGIGQATDGLCQYQGLF